MAGMREAGEQPMGPSLRGLLPILVVDVACPYLAYRLLTQYVPGISTTIALGLAGVFPAAGSVVSLQDRVDQRVLRHGCPRHRVPRLVPVPAAALVLHRPGVLNGDPARIAAFNDLWRSAGARYAFRLMTVVWGIGWVSEFLLRVLLVLTLTVGQVLIVSPIILQGIPAALIVWTISYARAARRRGEELRRAAG